MLQVWADIIPAEKAKEQGILVIPCSFMLVNALYFSNGSQIPSLHFRATEITRWESIEFVLFSLSNSILSKEVNWKGLLWTDSLQVVLKMANITDQRKKVYICSKYVESEYISLCFNHWLTTFLTTTTFHLDPALTWATKENNFWKHLEIFKMLIGK